MTHPLVSKAPNAVNETANYTQLPRTPAKSDRCDFDVADAKYKKKFAQGIF